MFHSKKAPNKAFIHTDDCKIVKADPDVEIPWAEVETGHWVATCQCGAHHHYDPPTPRTRLDPLDPSTYRHAPQCEYRDASDPAVIRLILDVKDGLEPGYWWVTCRACMTSWQVLHYAPAKSVG
jgi:hypothetical protein